MKKFFFLNFKCCLTLVKTSINDELHSLIEIFNASWKSQPLGSTRSLSVLPLKIPFLYIVLKPEEHTAVGPSLGTH